jgi:hypothetical protein
MKTRLHVPGWLRLHRRWLQAAAAVLVASLVRSENLITPLPTNIVSLSQVWGPSDKRYLSAAVDWIKLGLQRQLEVRRRDRQQC